MTETPTPGEPLHSTGEISSNDEFVTLGKIIGLFGVRGWVKVHSDTDPRENIVSFPRWWLNNEPESIVVKNGKRSGKNVVAQLAGIDTREQAEVLLGKEIAVKRSMLPTLSGNEFYWTDLVGCEVFDLEGLLVGPVERLFETGANDVMVVRDARDGSESNTKESHAGEILIPWIRPSVITSVNLTERRIVVDWDPDLL